MTTTWVTTVVTTSAALVGGAMLLLRPIVVAQTTSPEPIRTIDVTLSRYAFSPEHIEVGLGEPVVFNIVSIDGAHGFQVKELRLNARVPARGRAMAVLTPTRAGTFQITCSEYCGAGHSRMKARLIVTPGT